jgi:hypothetical protein
MGGYEPTFLFLTDADSLSRRQCNKYCALEKRRLKAGGDSHSCEAHSCRRANRWKAAIDKKGP